MKERARELKAEARLSKDKAEGERAVLASLAAMPQPDRTLGERLHAIVMASAPALCPKLWYGMPAYANPPAPSGDGKVVCFFQAASKFKTRYASFAFTDSAMLDEGAGGMWPIAYGLRALAAGEEANIVALVRESNEIRIEITGYAAPDPPPGPASPAAGGQDPSIALAANRAEADRLQRPRLPPRVARGA